MTATTWQHRLDIAPDCHAVLGIAREFLASIPPCEMHALPERCRPPGKLFQDDIAAYAFELVTHECNAPEVCELAHKLARFFSHAATRLATLTALDLRRTQRA